MNPDQRQGFSVVSKFLSCFLLHLIHEFDFPRCQCPRSIQDSRKGDLYDYDEVLVDVVHEVFEVCINGSLGVNSCLLVGQHMVKLHNTYRNHLVFLSTHKCVPKYGIFYYLLDNHSDKVVALSNVPPVITELGRVLVIPQTLNS
jgi:hypothetical protein